MNNPVEEHLLNIRRRQFFGQMAQGIGAMALGRDFRLTDVHGHIVKDILA